MKKSPLVPLSTLQQQGIRLKHLGELMLDEATTIPELAEAAAECGLVLKFRIDPVTKDKLVADGLDVLD
jgi:hypothetical protein